MVTNRGQGTTRAFRVSSLAIILSQGNEQSVKLIIYLKSSLYVFFEKTLDLVIFSRVEKSEALAYPDSVRVHNEC